MKIIILSILVLTTTIFSKTQIVNIPETNFKNALIDEGVDTNNDGEISNAEAEAIKYLNVSDSDISNITGIEAFINLNTLDC